MNVVVHRWRSPPRTRAIELPVDDGGQREHELGAIVEELTEAFDVGLSQASVAAARDPQHVDQYRRVDEDDSVAH